MPLPVNREHDSFTTHQGLVYQLETLEVLRPGQYASIMNEEKGKLTKMQAAAQFQELIHSHYSQLNPFEIERHRLTQMQLEIKAEHSHIIKALNLADKTDYIKKLHAQLRRQLAVSQKNYEDKESNSKPLLHYIIKNAKILHKVLTPSLRILRSNNMISEFEYNKIEFINNPPQHILIMGNNDLRQVDFIASLYHLATSKPIIFVSGFGGHGTMHDPVFGTTEGEAIERRLLYLSIPRENIVSEYDAVDTGRNVKYMETFILLDYILRNKLCKPEDISFLTELRLLPSKQKRSADQDKRLDEILNFARTRLIKPDDVIIDSLLISGTPGGLMRQTLTYEKQSTLPWKQLLSLTPDEFLSDDYSENYYYSTLRNASINFIYALREVASFLDYTVNSDYLSNREFFNVADLKQAIVILTDNYRLLTGFSIDGRKLADHFITFTEHKSGKINNNEQKILLADQMNRDLKPMAAYYRSAFFAIETLELKQLTSKFSTRAQAERLDTGGTFGRLGLNLHSFFYHKENEEMHENLLNRKSLGIVA